MSIPPYYPAFRYNAEPSSERTKVSEVNAIRTERSGRRGRPRKVISDAFLQEAFRSGRNISISRVATSLGVHHNSVKHYMKTYKITRQPFSTITDELLDSMIRRFKDSHPNTGIRYIRGFLLQQGTRVQRYRIVASLSRVDDIAKVVLQTRTIKRREYKSARPNALWHLDGHHKLGPWGIVIHGITDGFDRVVGAVPDSHRLATNSNVTDNWNEGNNTQYRPDSAHTFPQGHFHLRVPIPGPW